MYKILVYIGVIMFLLICNDSVIYAIAPRGHIEVLVANIIIDNVLWIIPIIYLLGSFIYLIKSKNTKKEKIRKLVIWLIIIAVIEMLIIFSEDFIINLVMRGIL